jgi:hypothetical protein
VHEGGSERKQAEIHVRPEPDGHRASAERKLLLQRALAKRVEEHHADERHADETAENTEQCVAAQHRPEGIVHALEQAELEQQSDAAQAERRHDDDQQPRPLPLEKQQVSRQARGPLGRTGTRRMRDAHAKASPGSTRKAAATGHAVTHA